MLEMQGYGVYQELLKNLSSVAMRYQGGDLID
jgi:hypothetical protein